MIEQKQPLLSVRSLSIDLLIDNHSLPLLADLSFDLEAGETLCLVGESGSGKSFTGMALLNLLPTPPALPPRGEIFFKGQDLLRFSQSKMRKIRGKEIAMIFQNPMNALNPVYPIGTQMAESLPEGGEIGEEGVRQKLVESLAHVGFADPQKQLNQYPHQLSGGMKQRVLIAMALLGKPSLLIADEPTTALDVTTQRQILELLRRLQKERSFALLLITHDMGVVAEMADRVLVLYAGRGVEEGEVRELFASPGHPYTRALFASLPQNTPIGERLPSIPGSLPPLPLRPKGCPFHPRCSYADSLCRKEMPPHRELEGVGHWSACWLHRGEADG